MRDEKWINRKKKEDLGFLVKNFLDTYDEFNNLYVHFNEIIKRHGSVKNIDEISFEGTDLFEMVVKLEEGLAHKIKDIAHSLFRKEKLDEEKKPSEELEKKYNILYQELEKAISSDKKDNVKSIMTYFLTEQIKELLDWTIGQGFHHLMILRENLYLLKEYEPRYKAEETLSEKIESLARERGYDFSEEDKNELSLIKGLDRISDEDMIETKAAVIKSIPRLKGRFKRAARLLKYYIMREKDEETLSILGKNLYLNKDLINKLYRKEDAEELNEIGEKYGSVH